MKKRSRLSKNASKRFGISRIDFFYLSFANLTGGCCGQLLAVVVVDDVVVLPSFVLTLTVELKVPEPTLFLSLSFSLSIFKSWILGIERITKEQTFGLTINLAANLFFWTALGVNQFNAIF